MDLYIKHFLVSDEVGMAVTLRTHEHEFNIDRKLDVSVPLRKVGRIAAFRRGLRHKGYNLVRTVAEIQTISHLLDRDRDDSDTVFHTAPMEQVGTMALYTSKCP